MTVARQKLHYHIDWFHFKFRITHLQVDPGHCLEVLLCFPGCLFLSHYFTVISVLTFSCPQIVLCSLSPSTKFPNWCSNLSSWKDKSNNKLLTSTNYKLLQTSTNYKLLILKTTNQCASNMNSFSLILSSIFVLCPQLVCFFSSFSAFRSWLKHHFLRRAFLDQPT